jgi:two-component system response regulator HydG
MSMNETLLNMSANTWCRTDLIGMNTLDTTNYHASILDSINEGVFTVDQRRVISSFNRMAGAITGIGPEEAIGRKCSDIFGESMCTNGCPLRETMETGVSIVDREIEIINRENRRVAVSVSTSLLRDKDGNVLGGVETLRELSQIFQLRKEITEKYSFHDLISRNATMRGIFEVLPDVAASEATVLLRGDSGTGKELFARAVHNLSHRNNGPLVVVNCGAFPEHLLEAEIFGVKRGAYTGAVETRAGRLEMAHGGTLFLDEIGDLPLSLQVKLLRVLENREYQSLGDKQPKRADVRFIAATNRELEAMVEEGTFRRDLFFRINVVSLQIPPLRERREDIPLLLDFALDRFNRTYNKKIMRYSSEALQVLLNYSYPGNVRELINQVEQMVILCRGNEIDVKHLPPALFSVPKTEKHLPPQNVPSTKTIRETLKRNDGNRTKAAEELGVDRTTLWRWIKRAGL